MLRTVYELGWCRLHQATDWNTVVLVSSFHATILILFNMQRPCIGAVKPAPIAESSTMINRFQQTPDHQISALKL
jgi:hypothetical protein